MGAWGGWGGGIADSVPPPSTHAGHRMIIITKLKIELKAALYQMTFIALRQGNALLIYCLIFSMEFTPTNIPMVSCLSRLTNVILLFLVGNIKNNDNKIFLLLKFILIA